MSVELEFLAKAWGAVSAAPLPEKVKKQFETQVMPLLKVTPLTDPYITDAVNGIINGYFLSTAVEILQKNAKTSEELEKSVNGILKTKLILKSSTLVTGTVAVVSALVFGAFLAGSSMGAAGSEWWSKKEMAEKKADYDYKMSRLAFLEKVNADLMLCKDGKVIVQKDGRKACFYGENGWFIE